MLLYNLRVHHPEEGQKLWWLTDEEEVGIKGKTRNRKRHPCSDMYAELPPLSDTVYRKSEPAVEVAIMKVKLRRTDTVLRSFLYSINCSSKHLIFQD